MVIRTSNNKIKNHQIIVNKETIEWGIVCLLLLFSFFNRATLLVSMLLLLFLFFSQREIGAIKMLNIITLRTIINPGIAIGIDSIQNVKWIIIFLCSFYLMFNYRKIDMILKRKMNKILIAIMVYAIYTLLSSFIFSTLPIVAMFKLISYVIVFIGIIIGIAATYHEINWIQWMYRMLATLFILSIPLIPISVGYLRTGHSFQGLTNHPNMFGIVGSLFVALTLTNLQQGNLKYPLKEMFLVIATLFMIILCKSRTGFITSIFLIILYLIFSKVGTVKKLIAFNFFSAITILYSFSSGDIFQFIKKFMYKGQEDILFSRTEQVGSLMDNFLRNPWFGSGFAVPVTPYRTYAFSLEYLVEPGNLLLAVLSYGGLIGFILFLNYMFKILWINKKNFRYLSFLPIGAVLISMGEMVFFSSNNIAIWICMFLAIYVVK